MPLATLAPTIDATGISAPAYNDILNSLIESLQTIFGADIYLTPDTQDYQMIAVFALAIFNTNQAIIAAYNSFMPTFAQGAGLSALVKINGLAREAGTNSTATVTIVGVAGTVITNGIVADTAGNLWDLPASVTIPMAGTINVTATAQDPGAIVGAPNTITQIQTVVQGWQSVNNSSAATVGAAVEDDATLRQRQSVSTSISAKTPLSTIAAAIANSMGVERSIVYENNTGVPDINGIPGHFISAVVLGGDILTIATLIEQTKSPGTGTFGTTSQIVVDPSGVPITINFFELAETPIFVAVTIQPLTGYVAQDGVDLVNAIVNFINGLPIGQDVFYNWIFGPANNYRNPEGLTYHVTELFIGIAANPTEEDDISILFNQAASCDASNVVLTTL